MIFDREKDNNGQKTLEFTDKIQKAYKKTSSIPLGDQVIETDNTNVSESVNGLMES